MVGNIGLDHVQVDNSYNLKQKLVNNSDEDNPYSGVGHECRYYDVGEFQDKFSNRKKQISFLSLNIRGLAGNFEEFLNLLCSINKDNFKITVIGIQEVWNVPKGIDFDIPGYRPIEFRVRDPARANNNAGGGVAFWVDDSMSMR